MPVVVESFSKVAIWACRGKEQKHAIVVLAATPDRIETLALRVKTDSRRFRAYHEDGKHRLIEARASSSPGYVQVPLTSLDPWSVHLVVEE